MKIFKVVLYWYVLALFGIAFLNFPTVDTGFIYKTVSKTSIKSEGVLVKVAGGFISVFGKKGIKEDIKNFENKYTYSNESRENFKNEIIEIYEDESFTGEKLNFKEKLLKSGDFNVTKKAGIITGIKNGVYIVMNPFMKILVLPTVFIINKFIDLSFVRNDFTVLEVVQKSLGAIWHTIRMLPTLLIGGIFYIASYLFGIALGIVILFYPIIPKQEVVTETE